MNNEKFYFSNNQHKQKANRKFEHFQKPLQDSKAMPNSKFQ